MKSEYKVTIGSIKAYFKDLEDRYCPLSEKLVMSGYQQRSGGYIERAIREGIEVDYRKNAPSQYWHLMTYCQNKDPEELFTKRVVCGELLFWMAEACFGDGEWPDLKEPLETIQKYIIGWEGERPIYDRKKCNAVIQQFCFDRIIEWVSKHRKDFALPPEVIDEARRIGFEPKLLTYYKENEEYGQLFHPDHHGMPTGHPWFITYKDGKAKWLTYRDDRRVIQF